MGLESKVTIGERQYVLQVAGEGEVHATYSSQEAKQGHIDKHLGPKIVKLLGSEVAKERTLDGKKFSTTDHNIALRSITNALGYKELSITLKDVTPFDLSELPEQTLEGFSEIHDRDRVDHELGLAASPQGTWVLWKEKGQLILSVKDSGHVKHFPIERESDYFRTTVGETELPGSLEDIFANFRIEPSTSLNKLISVRRPYHQNLTVSEAQESIQPLKKGFLLNRLPRNQTELYYKNAKGVVKKTLLEEKQGKLKLKEGEMPKELRGFLKDLSPRSQKWQESPTDLFAVLERKGYQGVYPYWNGRSTGT